VAKQLEQDDERAAAAGRAAQPADELGAKHAERAILAGARPGAFGGTRG
jgi:hypothetical protein